MDELFAAIRSGDIVEARRCLNEAPGAANSRGPDGVSAILTALYYDQGDIVDLLTRTGCDLDIFDTAALGHPALLDIMLAQDPTLATAWSSDGYYPLELAAYFGRLSAVQRLLAAGAGVQVNEPSRNTLQVATIHAAVASRSIPIVEAVIAAGADVNATQQGGVTPLDAAIYNGDADIEALLLAHGADPTVKPL